MFRDASGKSSSVNFPSAGEGGRWLELHVAALAQTERVCARIEFVREMSAKKREEQCVNSRVCQSTPVTNAITWVAYPRHHGAIAGEACEKVAGLRVGQDEFKRASRIRSKP
jgi:hypothetical protein